MKTTSTNVCEPLLPFDHPEILQLAMPLGGLGAGCVCFNGHGGLQDFSIRNAPATTAANFTGQEISAFALLRVEGAPGRLVEGPFPSEKIYNQGMHGTGYRKGGFEGLPRFKKSRFRSGYPFGKIELSDPKIPVEVEVLAWSPLIPLDDINSGIPSAILEYTLHNTSKRHVRLGFSYHLSHPFGGEENGRNVVIPGRGIFFSNTDPADAPSFGSGALVVAGDYDPKIKAMWLSGGWFDAVTTLWRENEEGVFETNNGKSQMGRWGGRNGGSVLVEGELPPGGRMTIPIVIAWHIPNSDLSCGFPEKKDACCGSQSPIWQLFYASHWRDARAVVRYVVKNFENLRRRTVAFQRALLGSSLPRPLLDAVSANLAILKSPTILRQANGNLWGWEGCDLSGGCCHGSCTHVWNYAQSLPHLFPMIERTLRGAEFERSMNAKGHINFRSALPDHPALHDQHAAADGQLGGIMKLFRDWHISGDTAWMAHFYPLARRSLEYCIRTWDPQRKGILSEPHHNTYDIEFWGPDGMCSSVYVGALSAMTTMAAALNKMSDSRKYKELAQRATHFLEEELFNGEYFEQKVQFRDAQGRSYSDLIEVSPSKATLIKKQGPPYQYGKGCLADGVIGAWMAYLYGIPTPLDPNKIRKGLLAIHRNNFRKNLEEHANCQRPGYAIGREGGLLNCTWPHGEKPVLPFPYSDEVWTGIEYQVASHLIGTGSLRQGLEVVTACRQRYDGRARNPWNEYECGNYYARAMSSYALLAATSGFHYSRVDKTLRLAPVAGLLSKEQSFVVFFCTSTGFGTLTLGQERLTVELIEGSMEIKRLVIRIGNKTQEFSVRFKGRYGQFSLV